MKERGEDGRRKEKKKKKSRSRKRKKRKGGEIRGEGRVERKNRSKKEEMRE